MISLIVCTYNRGAYIYRTLKCIALNDFPINDYEVVLINNNCTDNTEEECKRFRADFPNVQYSYVVETKQGLSAARNRGIAEAKGDCLVFLDDDAFVQSDYLKYLQVNLSQYPEMMAFGGKIIPLYESGKEPEWMSPRLMPIVSAIDKYQYTGLFRGNSYPIGANMGFRRACIEKVGLFNEKLGRSKKNLMGGEEKDYFERIKKLKMPVFYFPHVVVNHVIPQNRTMVEYVKRMAYGAGVSEKVRCNSVGQYLVSLLKEIFKWGGSFVLWLFYLLLLKPKKANMILRFRWNVTKGLLIGKIREND